MGGGGGGVVINIQYFKFNPAQIKYRKLQKYIIYCCTSTEKVTPPPPTNLPECDPGEFEEAALDRM